MVWTSADGLSWTDAGRLEYDFMAAAARGGQLVLGTDHAGWRSAWAVADDADEWAPPDKRLRIESFEATQDLGA